MNMTLFQWLLHLFWISLVVADSTDSTTSSTTSTTTSEPPPKIDYEALAYSLLDNANIFMESHYNKKCDIFLQSNVRYTKVNNAQAKNELENSFRHFSNELAYNLSIIPLGELNSPTLVRQVKTLGKLKLFGLEETDYEKAMSIQRSMRNFVIKKCVCKYNTKSDCSVMYAQIPEIHNVVSRSLNPYVLGYYWTQWRDAIDEEAGGSFYDYTQFFGLAAAFNGHVTPSKTWYLGYEEDNFLAELESTMKDIMPLYRELHAYLRFDLRRTYERELSANGDLIPHHFMEQVLQHAWKANSVFQTPFPKRKLPDIKQKMDKEVYTPLKINDISAAFFESLGLNHFSSNFWNTYSRKISDEEAGPDCKASVFYFPPNVGLRYCPKSDYKKFLQMHGHMSELQYNQYRSNLPVGLDREACPGFSNALGEAAIISAGSPAHLERIGLIENYTMDYELSMNRLFRLGVHTLISMSMYFVNEKFIVDALDHRTNFKEWNCDYWKIQARYAGIAPPTKRNTDQFDPSYMFYKGLDPEKPNTVKLVSEILGYQFYKALCIAAGKYVPGDPEHPLHNCDFYDNENAGKLIKDVMKMGSTKHWREAMHIVTKEKRLSGKAIKEYYEPLYKWLKEKNAQNKMNVNWLRTSINCEKK